MPAYDFDLFDPPAPLALVTLRAIQTGKNITSVPMLIDSGSDVTLVPQKVIADLDLQISSEQKVELESFDGRIVEAQALEVDLVFLGVTFRGRLPVVNSSVGVLGRNILNRFRILLDGPNSNWERIGVSMK